jgi:predicted nuclease with TOPRIM domain
MKFAFRCLRREREQMLRYFNQTKTNFTSCLERPDKKQELVDEFQSEFNAIEEDLRCDPDAKAELHQRSEDLRERLWEMSDARQEKAEGERLHVVEDKWVEDHSVILTNIFLTAMQAEIDTLTGTRQIVIDYFRDAYSMVFLTFLLQDNTRLF